MIDPIVNFNLYYIQSNVKFYSRLSVLSFQMKLLKNKNHEKGKIKKHTHHMHSTLKQRGNELGVYVVRGE